LDQYNFQDFHFDKRKKEKGKRKKEKEKKAKRKIKSEYFMSFFEIDYIF